MASESPLSSEEVNAERELYRHHGHIIYVVKSCNDDVGDGHRPSWKYFGKRYNSNIDVPLTAMWLNENYMNRRWRLTTVWSHPRRWFRVPVASRTKQTALKINTEDQ